MEFFTKWDRGKVSSKSVKQERTIVSTRLVNPRKRGEFNPFIPSYGDGPYMEIVTQEREESDKHKGIASHTYRIPVDPETGRVPKWALLQRFYGRQGEGVRTGRNLKRDLKYNSKTIIDIPDGGFTPEQLIEIGWWQEPNSCDILGIDDAHYGEWDRGQVFGEKGISIFAKTPEREREIRDILIRNFRPRELRAALTRGPISIVEGNPGKGNSGVYFGRQNRDGIHPLNVPEIILRPGADEDTICHEFGHHLRRDDPVRKGLALSPLAVDEDGYAIGWYSDSMLNMEEACNVAETTGRTKGYHESCGYFWKADTERQPRERIAHDRRIMMGEEGKDTPLRDGPLRDRLEERFTDLDISHLQIRRGSRAPAATLAQQKKEKSEGTVKGKSGSTANRSAAKNKSASAGKRTSSKAASTKRGKR